MATEFTAADLELARTVRADIEQRGVVIPDRTVNFVSGLLRLVFRSIQRPAASYGELRTRKLLLGLRLEAGQRRKPTTVLLLS